MYLFQTANFNDTVMVKMTQKQSEINIHKQNKNNSGEHYKNAEYKKIIIMNDNVHTCIGLRVSVCNTKEEAQQRALVKII